MGVPLAKRGRPTAVERASRLDRVLNASVTVFAARGFDAASLDEIAASAEVTKRTLYADIGGKAALFAAAVLREQDRIRVVATDAASLVDLAAEIVFVLHSDSAVSLHRSVIAEASRFPDLAAGFYLTGPQHSIELLARALEPDDAVDIRAAALFSLLLGETHRRRLLGLIPAPTRDAAIAHASQALALLAP